MITEGQVVLFKFPQTDQQGGKLRPALVLRMLPGKHEDWLICMISSQLHNYASAIDEKITSDDQDFIKSGLKLSSIIRISRLAVVDANIFYGKLGDINNERLVRLKNNLYRWIQNK